MVGSSNQHSVARRSKQADSEYGACPGTVERHGISWDRDGLRHTLHLTKTPHKNASSVNRDSAPQNELVNQGLSMIHVLW